MVISICICKYRDIITERFKSLCQSLYLASTACIYESYTMEGKRIFHGFYLIVVKTSQEANLCSSFTHYYLLSQKCFSARPNFSLNLMLGKTLFGSRNNLNYTVIVVNNVEFFHRQFAQHYG
ncbi:Uncharacterised protein [Raoultella ornithinolytica]|nr:Uncharacterised protein [Raoultella ornithinolytica]